MVLGLRGNFYAFQVGTVKFISLDADDVIYQDGASAYLNSAVNAGPEATSSGAAIPNGTETYNRRCHHRAQRHQRHGGRRSHPQLGRLGRGCPLVGSHQRGRRLRLRDLRRRSRPPSRRDHHHLQVLRHPGGQQRVRDLHNGTSTLPTTPTETFVFGCGISGAGSHSHGEKEFAQA
jgi:hypothetical protein